MKLSFTLGGGLGDFILNYLGSPGDRLSHILTTPGVEVELRVSRIQKAGHDLLYGNPFFKKASFFEDDGIHSQKLHNDISNLNNLDEYPKLSPSLWLDEGEQKILNDLPKPYAVFHPFASGQRRNLDFLLRIDSIAKWIVDVAGLPLIVLGAEEFGFDIPKVKQIKGSSRLSVNIVRSSSFFVGSHSSMQCASWVYNIPSICIGPSHLLFHNMYSPNSYDKYLKPLFGKNIFVMHEQMEYFPRFFDHFLKNSTSLLPRKNPEECRLKLVL